MNKKATEKNNILTIGELAEVSGTRLTTLKYYTELGTELKGKRLTIKEIIDHFNNSTNER